MASFGLRARLRQLPAQAQPVIAIVLFSDLLGWVSWASFLELWASLWFIFESFGGVLGSFLFIFGSFGGPLDRFWRLWGYLGHFGRHLGGPWAAIGHPKGPNVELS